MRKHLRWAPALALALAAPLAAQGEPAALVVKLTGGVQVRHGGASAAAAIGERLLEGDEVLPGTGARAVLITRTGAAQVVTRNTTVAAPPVGTAGDLFERALKSLAQAASEDARTGGRQGMIRPIPGEPTLVAPRNGLVVGSGHPTFTWLGAGNAATSAYTIQIRSVAGGRPERYPVTGTRFTLPDAAQELTPGAEYAWTVAPKGGRAAQEVRFRIVAQDVRAQLAATLGQIRDLGLDPATDGAFLSAVVYRDLDLMYDAAAALDAVEKSGSMAAEAYLLKGEVLSRMGHEDEARKAFDKADELMR
jgi:hypothetical protein